ncbi:hypothetical protein [Niallia sp. FSL R7-0271]|uniref:hypothetical protein n=1 Tax=Niallia sp. FSL R7-0271 TaxID=2921678 RepID=UPI0030F636C4
MRRNDLSNHIETNIQGNIEQAFEYLHYAYEHSYSPELRAKLEILLEIVDKVYDQSVNLETTYLKENEITESINGTTSRTSSKGLSGTSFKPPKRLYASTNSKAPLIEQGRGRNARLY